MEGAHLFSKSYSDFAFITDFFPFHSEATEMDEKYIMKI